MLRALGGLLVGPGGLHKCEHCCVPQPPTGPCEPCVHSGGELCTHCHPEGGNGCHGHAPFPSSWYWQLQGPGRFDWVVSDDPNTPSHWQWTPYPNPHHPTMPCCCRIGQTSVRQDDQGASYSYGCLILRWRGVFSGSDGPGYGFTFDQWGPREHCGLPLTHQQSTGFSPDAVACSVNDPPIPSPPSTVWNSLVYQFKALTQWGIAGANARGWIHIGCRSLAYRFTYGSEDPWRGSWAAGSASMSSGTCNPDPCLAGACCCDGICFDGISEEDCSLMGGLFRGGGSECHDASCPVPCCTDEGCIEVASFAECAQIQGIPMPTGRCADECGLSCLGACCVEVAGPAIECHDGTTRSECTAMGGTWAGRFTTCETTGCTFTPGACCGDCGGCGQSAQIACVMGGGIWHAEKECAEVACPPVGACCTPDGGCIPEVTELCCTRWGSGGVWHQGAGCTPSPCGFGACCFPTGTCSEATEFWCAQTGGAYLGDDTSCDDLDPPCDTMGACCTLNDCHYTSKYYCEQVLSGEWHEKQSCDDLPCGVQCNSCCVSGPVNPDDDDGKETVTCHLVADKAECNALGGTYRPGVGCPGTECTNKSECVIIPTDNEEDEQQIGLADSVSTPGTGAPAGCARCGSGAGGNQGMLI
jgi:hypothetical protein